MLLVLEGMACSGQCGVRGEDAWLFFQVSDVLVCYKNNHDSQLMDIDKSVHTKFSVYSRKDLRKGVAI